MSAKTFIKICGITEITALKAACDHGARFIGFVFYPPSPRALSPAAAGELIRQLPSTVKAVGLFVDPDDETLEEAIALAPIDMIQLHGHETPQRVAQIKARFHRPVMKALRVADARDVEAAHAYEDAADWLLFDARPPKADLPGGTGQRFDWSLLNGRSFAKPWMLSGGLDAGNVGQALAQLDPPAVDVSSGVEQSRGIKDPQKIIEFIQAVKV